jgi:hypothetical protein
MKEPTIIQTCLDILKREDIKKDCKMLFKPILDFILYDFAPYIYLLLGLIFIIFLMILAILILLVFILRRGVHLQNT